MRIISLQLVAIRTLAAFNPKMKPEMASMPRSQQRTCGVLALLLHGKGSRDPGLDCLASATSTRATLSHVVKTDRAALSISQGWDASNAQSSGREDLILLTCTKINSTTVPQYRPRNHKSKGLGDRHQSGISVPTTRIRI